MFESTSWVLISLVPWHIEGGRTTGWKHFSYFGSFSPIRDEMNVDLPTDSSPRIRILIVLGAMRKYFIISGYTLSRKLVERG